ncbi:PaaI family thioesterase [Prevotella cerevisiae]|uniref:PaaI family thioesterase n=1 Tax=Segatella cerevisiae TaxID=2053716 RepID=A0ABT1BW12_9BACT|nr:PaaI family thioesterase [Segatella cerevisiae]MCO6024438.1 PaaI family thioesterase [Segatella cerevisiae]
MNIERERNILKREDGLSKTLGIEFISTPEPDTLIGKMKVDERNKQPFGFLSGGATLALAENLAGVGSMALCPGKICVGINVSGNHLKSVLFGDTVTAYGRLQHKGRTLHQWHIDIRNEAGELISTVQVTNYVLSPRSPKAVKEGKQKEGGTTNG